MHVLHRLKKLKLNKEPNEGKAFQLVMVLVFALKQSAKSMFVYFNR